MILKVLKVIYEKDTFSSKIISNKLGISMELVDELKSKLEIMGFIKREESCKKNKCAGCSCGCASKSLINLINWEITKKGLEFLDKNN